MRPWPARSYWMRWPENAVLPSFGRSCYPWSKTARLLRHALRPTAFPKKWVWWLVAFSWPVRALALLFQIIRASAPMFSFRREPWTERWITTVFWRVWIMIPMARSQRAKFCALLLTLIIRWWGFFTKLVILPLSLLMISALGRMFMWCAVTLIMLRTGKRWL